MTQAELTPCFFTGEQIADFQLIRLLRVHRLTESWYALRRENAAPIAVKFLRKENPGIPKFCRIAHFLRDNHSPFLIHVSECGETIGQIPYATMEYADRGTLRSFLAKHGKLPLANAVYLLRGCLTALAALHEHNIIHRDVKPDNIWLFSDGSFRLGDLDLAKLPGIQEEPGKVFGTASYISPEQAMDSTRVDNRSDLYSLALVLFEALTGTRFRPKNSFMNAVRLARSDRSDPPLEILQDAATGKLAGLLAGMMEYTPALRPGSAQEILAELDLMQLPDQSSLF